MSERLAPGLYEQPITTRRGRTVPKAFRFRPDDRWCVVAMTLALWGSPGCSRGPCATTCDCLDEGEDVCRDNCEQALTDAESAGCGAEADALSSCITDTDYSCDLDGGFSSLGACVIETADGCATQADLEGGPTRDNVCRSENAALAECTKGTE